jgi:hypothetical protein
MPRRVAGAAPSPKRSQAPGAPDAKAIADPKNSQSVSPPFDRVRARLTATSRSSTFRGSTSAARVPRSYTAAPQRALAQRDVATFPRPLEPLGKDCPYTRTKVDTRYPGVPCQDDYVFVPSSRGELRRCVAFNPTEWYAFSDHAPMVATFED